MAQPVVVSGARGAHNAAPGTGVQKRALAMPAGLKAGEVVYKSKGARYRRLIYSEPTTFDGRGRAMPGKTKNALFVNGIFITSDQEVIDMLESDPSSYGVGRDYWRLSDELTAETKAAADYLLTQLTQLGSENMDPSLRAKVVSALGGTVKEFVPPATSGVKPIAS